MNKEDDIKENDWTSKDFEVESKSNDGTNSVSVKRKGLYLVRCRYFDGKNWTSNSNIKSVQVDRILPILKWNQDKNTHGKSTVVQFQGVDTLICNWRVAVVDYVINAEEIDIFCVEFQFMDHDWHQYDLCFGFLQHPLTSSYNYNQSLHYKQVGAVYLPGCHNTAKGQIYQEGSKINEFQLPDTDKVNKNDRIGFKVNKQTKSAELFYNGRNVGTVFTNLPKKIVPAASGTGYNGKTTIKVYAVDYH